MNDMTPPVMPNAKLLAHIAQLEAEVERLRDHRARLLAAIEDPNSVTLSRVAAVAAEVRAEMEDRHGT